MEYARIRRDRVKRDESRVFKRGLLLGRKEGIALVGLRAAVQRYDDAKSNVQRVKKEAKRRRLILRKLHKKCVTQINELKRSLDEKVTFHVKFEICQPELTMVSRSLFLARKRVIHLAQRYDCLSFTEAKREIAREREAIRVIAPAIRRWFFQRFFQDGSMIYDTTTSELKQ
eukprot:3751154-Prymnesium_polylepis.1